MAGSMWMECASCCRGCWEGQWDWNHANMYACYRMWERLCPCSELREQRESFSCNPRFTNHFCFLHFKYNWRMQTPSVNNNWKTTHFVVSTDLLFSLSPNPPSQEIKTISLMVNYLPLRAPGSLQKHIEVSWNKCLVTIKCLLDQCFHFPAWGLLFLIFSVLHCVWNKSYLRS